MTRMQWLALAREALIRSDEAVMPSLADQAIETVCGDWRVIEPNRRWAYDLCNAIDCCSCLAEKQEPSDALTGLRVASV